MNKKGMVKMLKEFKTFALKGNMLDLAIGVIIGGAFNGLVSSLVNDVIMPILSIFTGSMDFSNWFIALDGGDYATLVAAEEAGAALIKYGSFLSGIINFVIMAFVVFLLVKGINRLKRPEVAAPVTTKKCPHCFSEINKDATKCAYCTSEV